MMTPVLLLGAFVLLIVASIALVRRLARGRNVPGNTPSCGHCGYNLTGSPGNRCPECGKLFIEAGVTFSVRERSRRSIVIVATAFALVLLASVIVMRTYSTRQARAARAQAVAARIAAMRQERQALQALQAQAANRAAGTAAPLAERSNPGDAGDNVADLEPRNAPASRPSF